MPGETFWHPLGGDSSTDTTIDTNTQTASYTLALTDAGKVVELDSASAVTLTVPTDASVAFPVGTLIEVYAAGLGAVTVAGDTGVTVRNAGSLAGQFASAALRKRAADEWVLTGALDGAGEATDSTIEANTQTASYTLTLADAGMVVEMDSASATTLTVPANATVAFPVGTLIEVYAAGSGTVSVAGDVGVTLRNAGDLSGQFTSAALRKRATDEWVLTGDLA